LAAAESKSTSYAALQIEHSLTAEMTDLEKKLPVCPSAVITGEKCKNTFLSQLVVRSGLLPGTGSDPSSRAKWAQAFRMELPLSISPPV
jgi:hypothetical protein